MGLGLKRFNVVLVEGTQHANGSQELRHQVLVAATDTIIKVNMGERYINYENFHML